MSYRRITACMLSFVAASSFAGEAPAPATPPTPAPATPKPAPGPAPVPQAPKFQTPPDIKDMTNVQYLMDMARVQLRYQDLERCEETLRKVLPLAKEPVEKQQALTMLGQLLQRKQDFAAAGSAFEDALGAVTDLNQRAQIVFPLCDVYTQQNESAKAEKLLSALREAVVKENKPEFGWIKSTCLQRLLAIWRKEEGKMEKIIAELEAAVEKDPNDIAALEMLGEVYTSGRRDPVKAAQVTEKLVERNPKDINLQMRLAMFYGEAREYDKAIAVHKKVIEGDPKFNVASSHYQIATLLLQSGKKDEAIAWAKKNLSADQVDTGSAALLATFLEQVALNDDAMAVYETIASKATVPQMKADYLMRAAEVARRIKNYDKAEKLARGVMKDFASDKGIMGRAKQLLIRVYEDQGKIGDLKFDN